MKYEDHPVMLPHELIYYVVCAGRALESDLADMTSRMDQNLVNMQTQFCAEHNVDTNDCICLGVHGDGYHMPRAQTKKCPLKCSWNFLFEKHGQRYLCLQLAQ